MALDRDYFPAKYKNKEKSVDKKFIEVYSPQNFQFVLVLISFFIHSAGVRTSKCPCCDASLLPRR